MAHVIAVVNHMGGVSKTATVANLGWELVVMGHSCLVVDLDPQGSLTISLGFDPDTLDGDTIYEGMVLPADHPQHRDLHPQLVELTGLALIPANLDLAAAELDLNTQYQREFAPKRALAPLLENFEFILIGFCPPMLGVLAINALAAAAEAFGADSGGHQLPQPPGTAATLAEHPPDAAADQSRLAGPRDRGHAVRPALGPLHGCHAGTAPAVPAARNPGAEGYRQLTQEVLAHYE